MNFAAKQERRSLSRVLTNLCWFHVIQAYSPVNLKFFYTHAWGGGVDNGIM